MYLSFEPLAIAGQICRELGNQWRNRVQKRSRPRLRQKALCAALVWRLLPQQTPERWRGGVPDQKPALGRLLATA